MSLERLPSASRYAPVIGFCSAVRAGELIFLSGMTAVGPDGSVVGEHDPSAQATECIRKLDVALTEFGADLACVVNTRIYLTDRSHWQAVGEAHGAAFREAPPAATMLVVAQLLDERMLVEIEAVAFVGG